MTISLEGDVKRSVYNVFDLAKLKLIKMGDSVSTLRGSKLVK